LLSLRALVFFGVGMFAAAGILGGFAYLLQRAVGKIFVRALPRPTPRVVLVVSAVAWTLFAVDTAVTFVVARAVYWDVLWR
jgi:hypothetical protein